MAIIAFTGLDAIIGEIEMTASFEVVLTSIPNVSGRKYGFTLMDNFNPLERISVIILSNLGIPIVWSFIAQSEAGLHVF
jgi:hypothetical protein